MGLQVLASDKLLRMNNFSLLGMVQTHEVQAQTNATDVFELGRTTKVDTALELETSGSLELLSIGNTAGMLARMVVKRTAGAFVGFFYSGAGNKNNYCFTEADLVDAQFDLVVYEKPDQLTFTRSMWLPRCFLTTISGRAEAGGLASETYSWGGQDLVGLETPYHDIIATPCTVATSTTLTSSDATATSANYTLLYVYVDDQRFRNNSTADATKFSHSGVTLTVVTTEGYTIPANAVCRAVFYKTTSPSTTFPTVTTTDRGTTAFYVRGAQVNLFICPDDPDAPLASEKWLRVQSLDYTIDLRSEQLRQLNFSQNGSSIYCRVPTLPFDISVNASTYESDWLDWKAMINKTFPGNNVYEDSFDFNPNTMKGDAANPISAVLHYRTKGNALLQETQFTDLRLESPAERTTVQGRGEITWAFRGTALKICGYNV